MNPKEFRIPVWPVAAIAAALLILPTLATAQTESPKAVPYLLNDSHFHLTNYVQEGTDIREQASQTTDAGDHLTWNTGFKMPPVAEFLDQPVQGSKRWLCHVPAVASQNSNPALNVF